MPPTPDHLPFRNTQCTPKPSIRTPGSLPQAKPLVLVTDTYKTQLWAGHEESSAAPAHLTQQSSTESAPHSPTGGTVRKSQRSKEASAGLSPRVGPHGLKKPSASKPQQSEGGTHLAPGPQQLSWRSPHWPPHLEWELPDRLQQLSQSRGPSRCPGVFIMFIIKHGTELACGQVATRVPTCNLGHRCFWNPSHR